MATDHPHSDSSTVISLAVTALSVAAFGGAISQRVTDPLLVRLSREFGQPLGTVSWVITCFTIGYALCQLFFGPIGDRYGKYRVITWGCIASALTTLCCAVAPGLPWLLVARAAAGGMTAAIIPLAMAWIGDVVPYERRQPVLARFLIGQIMGVACGQVLGGLSADYLSWRTPFFIITALFCISTALLFLIQRRLPTYALITGTSNTDPMRHMTREFSLVFASRLARVVMLTVFLEGACVFGAFAFIAAHLHHALGLSFTVAGSIVMLYGFGGLSFALTSRRLVQRLGEVGLARNGAALMLVGLSSIAFVPNTGIAMTLSIVLVALACFALGMGFYMLHNTLQTNATQMAPERRGAAVSAFAFCYFLGQSTGLALAGWVVGHIGTTGLIAAGGVCVLLVGLNFARQKLQLK